MNSLLSKRRSGLQLKMALPYFIVIGIILILLNFLPTMVSQNFVFQTKEESMNSKIALISASLSPLEGLSEENVSQVVSAMKIEDLNRIVVCDELGKVLYDSSTIAPSTGRYALQKEVVSALRGYDVFRSVYKEEAFQSIGASPVVSNGRIIGSIYLFEYDSNQAGLLKNVQKMITILTVSVCVIAIILGLFFSRQFSGRVHAIVSAMHEIHDGNLEKRILVKGNDEISEVGEQFNVMVDQLEKTEQARSQFVSDASHEMKTPLAAIKLLTESLLQTEDVDRETANEFIEDINVEAERLSRLTEKLLMLSKSDAEVAAWRQRVDLREVALKAVHMVDPLATSAGVDIQTELQTDCFIYANEDDIYQVVYNLMENAIKYNKLGGTVSTFLFEQASKVVLVITDDGIGIPEQDLPHVFDRFYRVDKDRSREKGGTGLGLSIVWENVHRYDGEIKVESEIGKGTRFEVSFPMYLE